MRGTQRVCSLLYLFLSWQNVSFNVFRLELSFKKNTIFSLAAEVAMKKLLDEGSSLVEKSWFRRFSVPFPHFVVCSTCWLGEKSLIMWWEKELINFSQQHSRTPVNVSISYIFIHLGNKMHSASLFFGYPCIGSCKN